MINEWVTNCSLKISRADYVGAIQVRSSTRKTPARAAIEEGRRMGIRHKEN